MHCRSGIDKADMDMFMTLLWRLETSKQAAMYNEARVASFLNLEYMYLQYSSSFSRSLNMPGVVRSAVKFDNFGDIADPYFADVQELYPSFLSKVTTAVQQPIFDVQKQFMSTLT